MSEQQPEKPIKKQKNLSLRRKSSARLMAVQALYQDCYADEKKAKNPDKIIASMWKMLEDEKERESKEIKYSAEPNKNLFSTIISGVCSQYEELDIKLDSIFGERWNKGRLSRLMRSILQAAAFELIYIPERKAAIIIDEYTNIAAKFFSDPELGLINGLIQEIVNKHQNNDSNNDNAESA